MKKAQSLPISKLIITILIVIAVIAVIFWIFRSDIGQRFKNIFPEWKAENHTRDYEFSLICPIKSAIIVDSGKKYLEICTSIDCSSHKPSGLYLYDNLVYHTSGKQVGQITRGNLVIFPEILSGVGSESNPDLYYELKDSLPSLSDLLKLHFSYFYSDKELCRDSITTEKDWQNIQVRREMQVPVEYISSGILYYSVNELIENKGKSRTNLYRDTSLNLVANSWIDENWDTHYLDEENKSQPPGFFSSSTRLVEKSNEDVSYYLPEGMVENQEYGPYEIKGSLDNQFNKLGVNTGGDNFVQIKFKKLNSQVYVQFADDDALSGDDTSPWIKMEYWNSHKDAARLPAWAIL